MADANPKPGTYVSAQRPPLSRTTAPPRTISTRSLAISAVAVSLLAAVVTVVTTRSRSPEPAAPPAEQTPHAESEETTLEAITAEPPHAAPEPQPTPAPAPAADPTPRNTVPKTTARPSRPVTRPFDSEQVSDRPPHSLPPPPVWNGRIVDGRIDHPEPMPPSYCHPIRISRHRPCGMAKWSTVESQATYSCRRELHRTIPPLRLHPCGTGA